MTKGLLCGMLGFSISVIAGQLDRKPAGKHFWFAITVGLAGLLIGGLP